MVRSDPTLVVERMLEARRSRLSPDNPDRVHQLWMIDRLPRSAAYDPTWLHLNHMGPNVLWLTEALGQAMELDAGMRVLDLGCGTALSSIFLAKEYGVRVVAADLWVRPSANWQRIVAAGVGDLVTPMHAEAHVLPYADGYFDAIVSVDAYHYFGTDERYLGYLTSFLRYGGQLGVVVPGNEVDVDDVPTGLPDAFGPTSDYFTFRSPAWWRRLWERSGLVEVDVADMLKDGRGLWKRFLEMEAAWDSSDPNASVDGRLLASSAGQTLGFTRLVARRLSDAGPGSALMNPEESSS